MLIARLSSVLPRDCGRVRTSVSGVLFLLVAAGASRCVVVVVVPSFPLRSFFFFALALAANYPSSPFCPAPAPAASAPKCGVGQARVHGAARYSPTLHTHHDSVPTLLAVHCPPPSPPRSPFTAHHPPPVIHAHLLAAHSLNLLCPDSLFPLFSCLSFSFFASPVRVHVLIVPLSHIPLVTATGLQLQFSATSSYTHPHPHTHTYRYISSRSMLPLPFVVCRSPIAIPGS